jgi:hypothetical protein
MMNLAYEVSLFIFPSDFFTHSQILPQGAHGYIFPPKEGMLRILNALKNPSPRSGLNPRTLGQIASTLVITLPRTKKNQLTNIFTCTQYVRKLGSTNNLSVIVKSEVRTPTSYHPQSVSYSSRPQEQSTSANEFIYPTRMQAVRNRQ